MANEYNTSDPIGKKIMLQSFGAKFIRKDGEMVVKLEEPYSLVLKTEVPKLIPSEPEIYRSAKAKMGSLDPEIQLGSARGKKFEPNLCKTLVKRRLTARVEAWQRAPSGRPPFDLIKILFPLSFNSTM